MDPLPQFCDSLSLVAPLPLAVPPQPPPDDGIYWQVNIDRFHQHFRDQGIVSAVANRMDQVRGGAQNPPEVALGVRAGARWSWWGGFSPCSGAGRGGPRSVAAAGRAQDRGSSVLMTVSFTPPPPKPDQQRNSADDAADERSHHVLQRPVHSAALFQRGGFLPLGSQGVAEALLRRHGCGTAFGSGRKSL